MTWFKTIPLEEIDLGTTREVVVDAERVLLCRTGDRTVHAIANCCTHDGGILGEGTLDGHIVQCPRHGAQFDVRTGAVVRMPASSSIESFPVEIDADGRISVALEDD